MPYIGKQPEVGAYKKLDSITAVNGQAAYTLQHNSANFSPASANHLIVSLNGVIQAPQDSFTVSGSTLTFASNLSTGDSIDFILALGDVLSVGTPSDNTVTNDKLSTAPTIISKGAGSDSGAIQLNCEVNTHGVKIKGPPHSAGQSYTLTLPSTAPSANKALITDGSGNLSFGSAGGLVKLLTQSNVAAASSYDIDSTYINSTYDDYFFTINCITSATTDFYARFFVGGSVVTGAEYFYHGSRLGISTYNTDIDGATEMHITHGTATSGYGMVTRGFILNVNSTTLPATIQTNTTRVYGSANIRSDDCQGGQYTGSMTNVVNGIRFYMDSGTIEVKDFKLYGIAK